MGGERLASNPRFEGCRRRHRLVVGVVGVDARSECGVGMPEPVGNRPGIVAAPHEFAGSVGRYGMSGARQVPAGYSPHWSEGLKRRRIQWRT